MSRLTYQLEYGSQVDRIRRRHRVVRTRPQATPLAMIPMGKSIHGFPFLSCTSIAHRLVALRAIHQKE